MNDQQRIAEEEWGRVGAAPAHLPDASDQLGKLAGALAKARAAIAPIVKSKTANAGKYGYTYADLATAVDASTKALSDHGLAYVQRCRGRELETVLLHESGQWIAGSTPILTKGNGPQDFGSGMTYARRYGLLAMLGMAPEDDDGAGAQRGRDSGRGVRLSTHTTDMPRATLGPSPLAKELAEKLNRKRAYSGYQQWLAAHGGEVSVLDNGDREYLRQQVRGFLAQHPKPEPPPDAGDAWVADEAEADEAEADANQSQYD